MQIEYKGYLISPVSTGPKLYYIATAGRGGKIPNIMSGSFTSTGLAKQTVDMYLESNKKQADDKEISKG